jgi:predicted metal-dependent enzyme (double-stranded beta helix superfamily)
MNDFNIERFAEACQSAMRNADDPQEAVATLLKQTLGDNDHQAIIDTLAAAIPPGASIGEMIVHRSDNLTLLYARVPPRFQSGIHNHTVFACIGQLSGEERNTMFAPREDGSGLDVARKTTLSPGEVLRLPADVIHCIENPGAEAASALHVYGGDFGALMDARSLWSDDDHQQTPFSFPALLQESVKAMKRADNDAGLKALVNAIPATKPLVDAL